MTIASDLLRQHILMLVDDNENWQTVIADDIVLELAYAPSLGHPARLSEREAVVGHASWFVGAVENFRFFDLRLYPLTDPEGAIAEVKGEGLIRSTGRMYRQDYVCSYVLYAGRSRSCANISTPCVRLRRWIPQFSDPESLGQVATSGSTTG
jgi:ketosteroid isomerase-like protein